MWACFLKRSKFFESTEFASGEKEQMWFVSLIFSFLNRWKFKLSLLICHNSPAIIRDAFTPSHISFLFSCAFRKNEDKNRIKWREKTRKSKRVHIDTLVLTNSHLFPVRYQRAGYNGYETHLQTLKPSSQTKHVWYSDFLSCTDTYMQLMV